MSYLCSVKRQLGYSNKTTTKNDTIMGKIKNGGIFLVTGKVKHNSYLGLVMIETKRHLFATLMNMT